MISDKLLSWSATVLLAAALIQLSACQRAESNLPPGMPPPEVTVVTVEARDMPAVFEYTGETAGSREVEVRARVTGILLKHNYPEGGRVAAGQSLFIIDQAPYQAALARAQADVASAEARHDQARRNRERVAPLFEQNLVSKQDYDDTISSEEIVAADLQGARARLTAAALDLKYTRVEAPVAGIAGRALRSDGNYVSGPEVLLTTVMQIDPIHVLFGVSDEERLKLAHEAEAGRLVLPENDEYEVTVKLADGSVYTCCGQLTFSDVNISDATGTSEARAELPNADGVLRPGQFVRVVLKGARRPGAILVPQRAVLEGPNGKFVYTVSGEGKAEARPVGVGDWQGGEWIITSGLAPGDRVIVDGVLKIGPGAPVTIATPQAPAPGGAG
jgi:membrane fusion protein (multidrug efflux system)